MSDENRSRESNMARLTNTRHDGITVGIFLCKNSRIASWNNAVITLKPLSCRADSRCTSLAIKYVDLMNRLQHCMNDFNDRWILLPCLGRWRIAVGVWCWTYSDRRDNTAPMIRTHPEFHSDRPVTQSNQYFFNILKYELWVGCYQLAIEKHQKSIQSSRLTFLQGNDIGKLFIVVLPCQHCLMMVTNWPTAPDCPTFITSITQ